MAYTDYLQELFDDVLMEVAINKCGIGVGDIAIDDEGNVGIVLDSHYNSENEVTVHWFTEKGKYKAARVSFKYLKNVYRITK